ncbi:unnamed protein product [Phaeothamnion confervicola]
MEREEEKRMASREEGLIEWLRIKRQTQARKSRHTVAAKPAEPDETWRWAANVALKGEKTVSSAGSATKAPPPQRQPWQQQGSQQHKQQQQQQPQNHKEVWLNEGQIHFFFEEAEKHCRSRAKSTTAASGARCPSCTAVAARLGVAEPLVGLGDPRESVHSSRCLILHRACHEGNAGVALAILAHLGDGMLLSLCRKDNGGSGGLSLLVNGRDAGGRTPLHCACASKAGYRAGAWRIIRHLLSCGAEIDAAYFAGRTPLHVAVNAHDPIALGVLLRSGANASATDAAERTPLQLCRGDPVLLEVFERHAIQLEAGDNQHPLQQQLNEAVDVSGGGGRYCRGCRRSAVDCAAAKEVDFRLWLFKHRHFPRVV